MVQGGSTWFTVFAMCSQCATDAPTPRPLLFAVHSNHQTVNAVVYGVCLVCSRNAARPPDDGVLQMRVAFLVRPRIAVKVAKKTSVEWSVEC